jgi:putative ABC transport system permease protein
VLTAVGVTANLFDVMGVQPLLGRGFQKGEDEGGGARVVVLSHGAWQRLHGGAPDVLGRTMVLNGKPHDVVGVMGADFTMEGDPDIWLPADMSNEHRQTRYLTVWGRLAPGVTLAQADQELDGIAATLAQSYPVENGGWSTTLVPAREQVVREVKPVLLVLLAAVGFVLLIACANVANLALGRATARESEMAVRTALGAGRARLHLQMLTESVVLALVGGLLGVAVAWVGVRAFVGFAPGVLPRVEEVVVDARILGFALAISVFTGLLFGVAPSLRVGATSAAGVLRESGRGGVGGRRSEVMRRALIVCEVALSLLLLVGAGLTLRSVLKLLAVNPGYATEHVVAARVGLDGERYRGNVTKVRYFQELANRMMALPAIRHAAVTSTLPLSVEGIDFDLPYHAEGHPDVGEQGASEVDYRIISPGYLDAMGIPLKAGRDFTEFDRIDSNAQLFRDSSAVVVPGHKVVLVNETFARQHWPGEDPIGKHVRLYYVRNDLWEVVGLVGDTRHAGLATPARPQVFVPLAQAEVLFGYMTVVARVTPGAAGVVQQMREVAIALDPNEPIYQIERIETLRAEATARDRMAALVFGAFALLAIALSAAGIYGVIAYQVARRTREIGVRIALGAGRARVVRDVVGEAAGLALLGIGLGVVGALGATRFAASMLFGVAPTDPLTFGSVSLLLLGVALAAALLPAARAAGIQPVEALRSE